MITLPTDNRPSPVDPPADALPQSVTPPSEDVNSNEFWYRVAMMFPFVYLPMAALIALLLSIIMPLITGVTRY